jgi:hypothetical protein
MPPPSKEIHFAIACLERIIQTDESTNNDQEELRNHFVDYYDMVSTNKKNLTQELAKRQKEVKSLTKQLEHYTTLCERLTPAHAKLSRTEVDSTEAEEDDTVVSDTTSTVNVAVESLSDDKAVQLDQLAEKFISMATANPKEKLTAAMLGQAFEVSERSIERIGFKNIATRALAIQSARIITDDKIKLFADFYNANGKYPLRKEILELKIISDPELRRLSPVHAKAHTHNKGLPSYIHKYVASRISKGESAEDQTDEPATEEPTEDTTAEVVEDTEENNDEPLIELPKKRTSSKPKTSAKVKTKPRRKAPVEEPVEEE